MDSAAIIWYILYTCPNLTPEEIEKQVTEKTAFFGGLIDRETILKLIAAELNAPVSVPKKEIKLVLKDLVDGLHGLQLAVTVKEVSPVNEFQKTDGTSGRLVRVKLSDESGEKTLLLWNEKTDLAPKLTPQQKLLVSDVYTKKNMFGEVELGLGRRGKIDFL
jgi:hypothetical protein